MIAEIERAAPGSLAAGGRVGNLSGARSTGMLVLCVWLLLAGVTAMELTRSVLTVLAPIEAVYAEAVVYEQAARIVRGEPLYQPIDRPPYSVAAYTPLYYVLAAALQLTVGPGFVPGRVLSFVAGAVVALLVGYLTARRSGSRPAGLFAATLFLALDLQWIPWLALYRVDFLGLALSLAAVALLVGGPGPRRALLGGALAALAFLTKQTFLAAGLAGTVYLWRRDRKLAALFAGCGLLIALGSCLALEIGTGAFIANTVLANVNPSRWELLVSKGASFAILLGGPLLLAWKYLRRAGWPRGEDELLALYWLGSALPMAGLPKVGGASNYWLELCASTAILATLGLWTSLRPAAGAGQRPTAAPLILFVPSLCLAIFLSVMHLTSTPSWSPAYRAELDQLVERVRSEPTQVLAEPLDVVALAGRPMLFEPYIFSILYSEGRWDPAPLTRAVCNGGVGLLVLGSPLEEAHREVESYSRWPAPVLAALRERMALESTLAGRHLYVPRRAPGGPACASLAS